VALADVRGRGARRDALRSLCAEIGEDEIAARMPLFRDGV
jgi:hypothetical protein